MSSDSGFSGFVELPPEISHVDWSHEPEFVSIIGEIDSEMATDVCLTIEKLDRTPGPNILIKISSPGGCTYSALRIVDTIKACKKRVVTMAEGMAFSGGAIIFVAGESRVVTPNTSIMFHNVASTVDVRTVTEAQIDLVESKRLRNRMLEMLHSTVTADGYDRVQKGFDKNIDIYLSASEALRYGVATACGVVRLRTKVSVKYSLTLDEQPPAKDRARKRRRVQGN